MSSHATRLAPLLASFAALMGAAPARAVDAVPVGVFTMPIYLTSAPGDGRAVYVVERGGTVKVVRGSALLAETFLDISSRVSTAGEGGLLSIAFPPDYATSGRLYLAYSNTGGNFELDELRRSAADPDRADPASRRTVLEIPHPNFTNHYGGQLQFGRDGYLYVSTGDGGGAGDPGNNAQSLGLLLGKLLRIDPRAAGGQPYSVPADNPFVGTAGARPEIYAYGLRNPWRFSFDRATGDLTIGDVGQNAREEVDFTPGTSGAGANFGWNVWEGTLRFRAGEAPGHVPPVLERPRNATGCTSLTGGYVVRDTTVPSLLGRYVYGDFCSGSLRSARLAVPRALDDQPLGVTVPSLASFGEDAAGCVYAVSLGGVVYRLVENLLRVLPGGPCALGLLPAA